MERRRLRPEAQGGAQGDDLGCGGVSGLQVREGTPDHRHQRPLRVPQQGYRHIHGGVEASGLVRHARARHSGLHHRAGGQQRPPRRSCGASEGSVEGHRRGAVAFLDPLSREPAVGSRLAGHPRQCPRERELEGEGHIRSVVPQFCGRHLQQELLRDARGHGLHGIPVIL